MGRKLPPKQLELYKRCDEILHYLWDPIGVRGIPGARDEYESYLPQVFKLVLEGSSDSDVTEYLLQIEENSMGLSPKREHAETTAQQLLEHREWIFGEDRP